MNGMRKPVVGGFVVPPLVGIGQRAEEAVHQEWNTLDGVENKLRQQGFSPMDTPAFACPLVTEDLLTTPDNKTYSEAFARQLAWFNYSSQNLARGIAELLQVQNEMELIAARLRRKFRQENKTNKKEDRLSGDDIQDEILLDPRYLELKHQEQKLQQYKSEMAAYYGGIERGLKTISRQVEIKKMESDQTRTNIPGRGYESPRRNAPMPIPGSYDPSGNT